MSVCECVCVSACVDAVRLATTSWFAMLTATQIAEQSKQTTASIYDERKLCVRLPVAIVAVADVAADTDDGCDSDVDDADDMEFDNFELDESFLALVLFPQALVYGV